MTPTEPDYVSTAELVLAKLALQRWCADKNALKNPKQLAYKRSGWQERRASRFDAAIVRVIDFERCFNTLSEGQQMLLLLAYREHATDGEIARRTGWSLRAIGYKRPLALVALARVLDKQDLL